MIAAQQRERVRRLMVEGCETAIRGALKADRAPVAEENVEAGIRYMVERIGVLASRLPDEDLVELAGRTDDAIRAEAAQVALAAIAPERPS